MKTFKCDFCEKNILSAEDSIGTGYAVMVDDNKKMCYACCGDYDKKNLLDLPIGGKYTLYLTEKDNPNYKPNTLGNDVFGTKNPIDYWVINWPDTFSKKVFPSVGGHNFCGKRYDFWFTLSKCVENETGYKTETSYFWGVKYGDDSEIAHIKKVRPW